MSEYVKYRVIAKVRESSEISSFVIAPLAGEQVPPFASGQYVSVRIPDGTVRTYTISSNPGDLSNYRITVKREAGIASSGVPGRVSSYLHDRLQLGDYLDVKGPSGTFMLDDDSNRTVVLLSGGVGITPMMSMLHALVDSNRSVHFVHACDNGDAHAFRAEVDYLASRRPDINQHYIYRLPVDRDRAEGTFHSAGLITREHLQRLVAGGDSEFYLCGPAGFMKMVYAELIDLGTDPGRIRYESFGPASILEPSVRPENAELNMATVHFARSNRYVEWGPSSGTLLEVAEANGLMPDFSCRVGVCNTCECDILAGSVRYTSKPATDMPKERVLLCIAIPASSKVAIDL
jgi:uncharacterized protein